MKPNKTTIPSPKRAAIRRRIFIVDDHPITRYGLTQLLSRESDLLVCGEAENAQEALAGIKPPLPDLVLADVGMPGKNIIEFIKDLRGLHPGLPVLILSTHDEAVYAERLVRAGARGYIMKSEGGTNLVMAVRKVLLGQVHLSVAMADRAFESFGGRPARAGSSVLGQLTDREFEVFELFGQGKTTREVAKQLCLSPKTVETHRLNLYRKLEIKTPGELIRYAVQFQQNGFGRDRRE